ncbi:hypothetical protein L9F63_005779 [Diploptera punctata]|uniref:Dehydrogenase E1 component domain-containing protein n=1 Tax=Diploptera punctata TaxID=6984 RepID=A0AAD8E5L7_DIPPU|nr:hypothetical protein L9F63_005779 [Diploptera punctata]
MLEKYPKGEHMMKSYVAVYRIIHAYQSRGHLVAKLDPLGIQEEIEDLVKRNYKLPTKIIHNLGLEFSGKDLNCEFEIPQFTFIGGEEKSLKLKEIITRLEKVYCQHIGLEYTYCNMEEMLQFIRKKVESPGVLDLSNDVRKKILKRLTKAVVFELFVSKKWPKTKRFGLEGAETLIPGIKQIIDRAGNNGIHTFIIGMAHRGRLNILTNLIHKPLRDTFSQFGSPEIHHGSGDVMYHLGSTIKREIDGREITLTLMPNPSHLETVSPLVVGRTRSEQFFHGDKQGKQVMPILIHGDAAFSAQGVVYETINLSNLPNYTSGGTIHFIINNQIGFTTDPRVARSTPNCSDLAQITRAPIFRVNGDDPDALINCCNLAVDFRDKFQKGVVIEIVCYRRHGHSELDDPSFTQPHMYKKIKELPNVLKIYIKKLVEENVICGDEAKEMCIDYIKSCEKAYQESQKDHQVDLKTWIDKSWDCFFEKQDPNNIPSTGVKEGTLKQIGMKVATPPPSNLKFDLHEGVKKNTF